MHKIRRKDDGVQIFNNLDYYDAFDISWTSWEIIKSVKKYGKEKAIQKNSSLFNISEKESKEDIETVLKNLKSIGKKIEDLPSSVSNLKWSPRTVHFDITPHCNSKCRYCLSSDVMKDKTELSTQKILDVVSELPNLETWIFLISGGEPFLRKDLFEIIGHADKLNILTQILTNGTLIDEEIAKKLSLFKYLFLQISLDSCIPEHHDYHRGVPGSFKKTVQGLKNLKKYGVKTETGMVITRHNLNDIEETASFLYNLGIKNVRIAPVVTYRGKGLKNQDEFSLSLEEIKFVSRKIIKLNKKYQGKLCFLPTREFVVFNAKPTTTKMPKCPISRSLIYIAPNGLVYPCIGTAHPQFSIGDIKKDTLTQIWKTSSLLKKIRYLTTDDIKKCSSCKFKKLCTGGCRADSYKYFKTLFAHDPLYCAYFKSKK